MNQVQWEVLQTADAGVAASDRLAEGSVVVAERDPIEVLAGGGHDEDSEAGVDD